MAIFHVVLLLLFCETFVLFGIEAFPPSLITPFASGGEPNTSLTQQEEHFIHHMVLNKFCQRYNPKLSVYRIMDPFYFLEKKSGLYYINGNPSSCNGRAIDYYFSQNAGSKSLNHSTFIRPSSIPIPGLFTAYSLASIAIYKNLKRFVEVEISLDTVLKVGGRLYPEMGSEVPSLYITVPQNLEIPVRLTNPAMGPFADIGVLFTRLRREVTEHLEWNVKLDGAVYPWLSYIEHIDGQNWTRLSEVSLSQKHFQLNATFTVIPSNPEVKALQLLLLYPYIPSHGGRLIVMTDAQPPEIFTRKGIVKNALKELKASTYDLNLE